MRDALADFVISFISEEERSELSPVIEKFDAGDYAAILTHPLVRHILGFEKGEEDWDKVDRTKVEERFIRRSKDEVPKWIEDVSRRLVRLCLYREHIRKSQETPELKSITMSPFCYGPFFMIVALACLNSFVQASTTGPPLSFKPEELILSAYSQPTSTHAHKDLQRELSNWLCRDDAAVYELMPHPELFVLARAIDLYGFIVRVIKPYGATAWLSLRIFVLYQRLLDKKSQYVEDSLLEAENEAQTAFIHEWECLSGEVGEYLPEEFTPVKVAPGDHVAAKMNNIYTEFLLERVNIGIVLGHMRWSEKAAMDNVCSAARRRKFILELTGVLGKRTKYQEKDVSQLVVLAVSHKDAICTAQEKHDDDIVGKEGRLESEQPAKEGETFTIADRTVEASKPRNFGLQDDTLLENISYTETHKGSDNTDTAKAKSALDNLDPNHQPMLEPLDSVILLLYATSITNNNPADGITREQTLPFATRVLQGGSSNWQVYSHALLLRSRIEGYSSRTTERGLLQLQTLVDQIIVDTSEGKSEISEEQLEKKTPTSFLPRSEASESASIVERLRYIWVLASPFRWDLEAELAARWVSLGGLKSALEIYERLQMWAEMALCLAGVGREGEARKVLRRQLFHPSSSSAAAESDKSALTEGEELWNGPPRDPRPLNAPRLYCVLGDIDNDPVMYEKAWEVSKGRSGRAQRSLGHYHYAKRDFEKARDAYKKSLHVDYGNESAQFNLGCAQLELKEYSDAQQTFAGMSIAHMENAEAWSNQAAALLLMDQGPDTEPLTYEETRTERTADGQQRTRTYTYTRQSKEEKRKENRKRALKSFKHAAQLKHDDYRLWENVLTTAASTVPPGYEDIIVAQKRLIELRAPKVGEAAIDIDILEALINFVIVLTDPDRPFENHKDFVPKRKYVMTNNVHTDLHGLPRLTTEFMQTHVIPTITASPRLWLVTAKFFVFSNRPSSALEAYEKAWRTVIAQPGWDRETEKAWEDVAEITVTLVDAYESLGERPRTEGLGANEEGIVVAKDWKFKARSALRSVMGRGKETWEGTAGWEKLVKRMEELKGA